MKISLTPSDAPSVEVKYGQLSTESLPTKRRHRVKQIGGGGSLYFIAFKKER